MRLTSHVRFWIGDGGSNPVADHTKGGGNGDLGVSEGDLLVVK